MEQQRGERDEGEAGGLTPHPSGDIRVPVRKRSVQVLGRMMSAMDSFHLSDCLQLGFLADRCIQFQPQ